MRCSLVSRPLICRCWLISIRALCFLPLDEFFFPILQYILLLPHNCHPLLCLPYGVVAQGFQLVSHHGKKPLNPDILHLRPFFLKLLTLHLQLSGQSGIIPFKSFDGVLFSHLSPHGPPSITSLNLVPAEVVQMLSKAILGWKIKTAPTLQFLPPRLQSWMNLQLETSSSKVMLQMSQTFSMGGLSSVSSNSSFLFFWLASLSPCCQTCFLPSCLGASCLGETIVGSGVSPDCLRFHLIQLLQKKLVPHLVLEETHLVAVVGHMGERIDLLHLDISLFIWLIYEGLFTSLSCVHVFTHCACTHACAPP